MTDLEIIEEIKKQNKNVNYEIDENNYVTNLKWTIGFEGPLPKEVKLLKNLKDVYCFGCKNDDLKLFENSTKIEKLSITSNEITLDYLEKFINSFDNIRYFKILNSNLTHLSLTFLSKLSRLNLTINNTDKENGFKCDSLEYPPKILTNIGLCEPELYIKNYKIFEEYQQKDLNLNLKIVESLLNNDIKNKWKDSIALPFALKQFYINDFRGIKNIYLNEIPDNTQWIFLTGENGFGKTSLLQALCISLFGKNEDDRAILDTKKSIKSFVTIHDETHGFISNILDIKNGLFNGSGESMIHFVAYGAVRVNKSADRRTKTYSLFNSDGTLLDIESKFKEWYKSGFLHEIYEKVKIKFLKLLSPYIDDIKVEIEKTSKIVKYHETDSEENVWLTYDELASGYKSIIAAFGDMIIRLTESNGAGVDELLGIVLIDEFDLHLHPKWQKELVEKLTNVFPKVQFIVSTHSPIPLLGAPENSIVINVDRDKENGITAKILDVDFKNLTPNSILTSPIFNFRSIIPNSNKDLKDLVTADDYNEVLFQKIVKQKLDNFVAENDADY
ncbi:MAG: AAA family ATPase [Bacteroidales bacterium]|nr:AAA family ATPase [Bacteroidales bacterium]